MARKAVHRSTRKNRFARPRQPQTSPSDEVPIAEGLPSGDTSENLPPVMSFDRPTPTPEQLKEREELQRPRKRIDDFLNAPQRLAAASYGELQKIGERLDNLLNTQQRATMVSRKELQKAREDLNGVLDAQQRATTVSHRELRKIRERLENFPNAPLPVTVTSSVPLELAPVKPATVTEPVLALAAQIDSELAELIEPTQVQTLAGLDEDELRLLMGKNEHRPTEREIKRFAFRTVGNWRRSATKTIKDAARKDEKFKRDVPRFPSDSTWLRGLDRKE